MSAADSFDNKTLADGPTTATDVDGSSDTIGPGSPGLKPAGVMGADQDRDPTIRLPSRQAKIHTIHPIRTVSSSRSIPRPRRRRPLPALPVSSWEPGEPWWPWHPMIRRPSRLA
jgi:hypothetical protein